jgi:hypothetical protein
MAVPMGRCLSQFSQFPSHWPWWTCGACAWIQRPKVGLIGLAIRVRNGAPSWPPSFLLSDGGFLSDYAPTYLILPAALFPGLQRDPSVSRATPLHPYCSTYTESPALLSIIISR